MGNPSGNPATLAPPFTKENAREMALRGAATRKRNRELEKQLLAQAADLARKIALPSDDEARKSRVQKQIDILLTDMEKTKSVDVRLRISAALDRLWKLVTPTAGVLRPPKRGAQQSLPPLVPISEPQDPQQPG